MAWHLQIFTTSAWTAKCPYHSSLVSIVVDNLPQYAIQCQILMSPDLEISSQKLLTILLRLLEIPVLRSW